MKTILIIAYSPLSRDPRVRRQIEFLSKNYNIIAAGFDDPQIDGVKFILCNSFFNCSKDRIKYAALSLLKQFEAYYWYKYTDLYELLLKETFDFIIANDPETLPLASRLAKKKDIKFIADMHEYSLKENEGNWKWEIFFKPFKDYLCSKYLKKAESVTTVCAGIMELYKKDFQLNKIDIITNAPKYQANEIKPTERDKIKIIHHGLATAQRRIEITLDMMEYLDDRFHLDLYLITTPENEKYYQSLREKYENKNNISFKQPVGYNNINNTLRDYDIGIFILPAITLNSFYALPNKLFEFAQARLAIAIGPSIEMMQYVKKYQSGIVSKDFTAQAMAEELNKLNADDIDLFKKNADLMAIEECAEKNMAKLEGIINNII